MYEVLGLDWSSLYKISVLSFIVIILQKKRFIYFNGVVYHLSVDQDTTLSLIVLTHLRVENYVSHHSLADWNTTLSLIVFTRPRLEDCTVSIANRPGHYFKPPLELVGLGSSSSMESIASWILMAAKWRRRRVERRRHFKEKMSQEEAHHHRKPWIRAWR